MGLAPRTLGCFFAPAGRDGFNFSPVRKVETLGLRAAAMRRLASYTLKGTGAPACGRVKHA